MIVLDTHIWLWFINSNFEKFSSIWRECIESADRVGVSPVSCYEIVYAHHRGRIKLTENPQAWLHGALFGADIELLPLTAEVAVRAVELSPTHKDPFDRIIIATTLCYDAQLASLDSLVTQYPELVGRLLPKS